MSREQWYRRTTWTEQDRSEFFQRLFRSRGQFHKAQYLRIQAFYLVQAGEVCPAMELLKRLFDEFAEKSQMPHAHLQMAECHLALNNFDDALDEYRASLAAELKCPGIRTNVWLAFPWLVVVRTMRHLYPEARQFLDWGKSHLATFPIEQFQLAAIQSFMAADEGQLEAAGQFARIALEAAGRSHSGYRYHAKLGLVENLDIEIRDRLERLAHP